MAKFYGYTNVGGSNVSGVTVVARYEGKTKGDFYYYTTESGPDGYYELEVPSDLVYNLYFSQISGTACGATYSLAVSIGSTSYEAGCGFSLSRSTKSNNITINEKSVGPLSYWTVTAISKEFNYSITQESSGNTPLIFNGLIDGEEYSVYYFGSTGGKNGSARSKIIPGGTNEFGLEMQTPKAQTLPDGGTVNLTDAILSAYTQWTSGNSNGRVPLYSIVGPDVTYVDNCTLCTYDIEEKIFNRF